MEEMRSRLVSLEKELEDQKVNASIAVNDQVVRVNMEWGER